MAKAERVLCMGEDIANALDRQEVAACLRVDEAQGAGEIDFRCEAVQGATKQLLGEAIRHLRHRVKQELLKQIVQVSRLQDGVAGIGVQLLHRVT
ncbi:MAG: hypothetical protein MUO41_08015, partial [Methyloceanibacter sp.]|nr:hypothetical protein [Methyloceanibacter sp.]